VIGDASLFRSFVQEALDSLPEQFAERLWNLVVKVEREPSDDDLDSVEIGPHVTLFGLYTGVPLTQRGANLSGNLPDVIIVFRGPITRHCRGEIECVRRQVRETVIHEVAHYFGISDERLMQLDRY